MIARRGMLIWSMCMVACEQAATAPSQKSVDVSARTEVVVGADAARDAAANAGDLAACVDTDPFGAEACGVALAAHCRAFATERDCVSSEVAAIGGREWPCAWAKVTTYSDVDTCSIASIEGRCFAYLAIGGGGRCAAYPADGVVVDSPTGRGGSLQGPIGRWTSLEVQRTEPREKASCRPGLSPPAPALCECSEACR